MFFGVDSDDWLTSDAIEVASRTWKLIQNDSDIAGFIALHGANADTEAPLGTWMPRGVKKANAWDLYNELGFKGDACQVYKTAVLKEHPYPVVDGEKFISECIVQYAIAQKKQMLLINTVLVLGSYLDDGLTGKSYSLIREYPNGYILVKEQSIDMSKHLLQKMYHMTLCISAYRLANKRYNFKQSKHKVLFILCWLPSWISYRLILTQ